MTLPPPDWRPPHAYVPGQSPRHADNLFTAIRASARSGDPRASDAFHFGLSFLQDGYFWEAHEVLEPVWMTCPPESDDRYLVQALIQLANAGLKRRMNRPEAVARLLEMADGLAERVDATLQGPYARLRLHVATTQLAAMPAASTEPPL